MPGKPVATIGNMHVCPLCNGTVPHVGGPVTGPGVPTFLINNQPVAVLGDMCTCVGPPDSIIQGAAGFLVDNKPVALMGSITAHGGQITQGNPGVTIGPADPPVPWEVLINAEPDELLEIEVSGYGPALFTGTVPDPVIEETYNNVEESKEVTLESRYALERAFAFADDTGEAFFLLTMINCFGDDIPVEDYAALYSKFSHKEIEPPEIAVVKNSIATTAWFEAPLPLNNDGTSEREKIMGMPVGKHKPKKPPQGSNKIYVSEGFIRKAAEDNGSSGELMVALMEEFGHYIDYYLRNEIGSTGGDAPYDEGARFAWYLLACNFIDENTIEYANATIEGTQYKLKVDFSDLQTDLKEHVNTAEQTDNDVAGNREYFKVSKIDAKKGKYGHEDLMDKLVQLEIFDADQLPFINYGSWLRDFSQLITPMTVPFEKSKFGEIKAKIYKNNPQNHPIVKLAALNSIKPSRSFWTFMVEILGAQKFVLEEIDNGGTIKIGNNNAQLKKLFDKLTGEPEDQKHNYKKLYDTAERLAKEAYSFYSFRQHFGKLTPEILGVYRPEDHVDNTLGLENGYLIDPDLYKEPLAVHNEVNPLFGTKNYIRAEDETYKKPLAKHYSPSDYHTPVEALRFELGMAAEAKGQKDRFRHLGKALHTLQDFFCHSNFVELSLIKYSDKDVYPWTSLLPDLNIKDRETFFDLAGHSGKIFHEPYKDTSYNNFAGEYLSFEKVRQKYQPMSEVTFFPGVVFFRFNSLTYQFIQPEGQNKGRLYRNVDIVVNCHKHLRRLPLTSGTFCMIDTVASLADMMAESMIKPTFKFYANVEKGEIIIDLIDLLVLVLLNELSLMQGEDPDKKDEKLLGKSYAEWITYYKHFISIRSFVLTYLKKDWQRKIIETFTHMGLELFYFLTRMALYYPVEKIDSLIKEGQSLNNEISGNWGSNPTHTQLAKDEGDHPLNELAGKLSMEATAVLGKLLKQYWQSKDEKYKEDMLNLATEYFSHPIHVNWMEKTVREWSKTNPRKLKEAHSKGYLAGAWKNSKETLEEAEKKLKNLKEEKLKFDKHYKVWERLARFYGYKAE
ncbi:MAG: PAAR domain-containing protein [Bacteroidales bacterium]|nr:PAAR domain-containing protein [Bacteroidales bacterium]